MPSTAQTLFAYGSLMFPEVWMHVAGRERRSARASLAAHTALTVRGYTFPGLIPSPGSATPGRLYFDLDTDDWARLDAFEDTFYRREMVEATDAQGQLHRACAYVVMPDHRDVLSEAVWDAAWFEQHALADFLDRICGFDE